MISKVKNSAEPMILSKEDFTKLAFQIRYARETGIICWRDSGQIVARRKLEGDPNVISSQIQKKRFIDAFRNETPCKLSYSEYSYLRKRLPNKSSSFTPYLERLRLYRYESSFWLVPNSWDLDSINNYILSSPRYDNKIVCRFFDDVIGDNKVEVSRARYVYLRRILLLSKHYRERFVVEAIKSHYYAYPV